MKCRFDNQQLTHVCIDLGYSPPSNSFLKTEDLERPETHYPLKLFVSERTLLVQLAEYKQSSEIFSDQYIYFSSYSSSWLEHARNYCEMATRRFNLNSTSFVMEIASNDGYLLQYFNEKGIPNMGVEPSSSVAKVAQKKGIHTEIAFFGKEFAQKISVHQKPDLIIGNNVFAHVPDINNFLEGIRLVLAENGTCTLEFPHVYQLIEQNQFDTIYHEHYWYFSLLALMPVMLKHDLLIYEVEEIPTHGGSLRIYIRHKNSENQDVHESVNRVLTKERNAGMESLEYYMQLQSKADLVKNEFLQFILAEKSKGKKIAGYGAAAKGNTLMNYCGIRKDLISMIADASPYKQGTYTPGSHVPVVSEQELKAMKPDYIIIFPWNLSQEIMDQMEYAREWGCRFIIPLPKLKVL